MKRDMDLVRSILLQVEAATEETGAGELDFCGHTADEVHYHIELMQQRGLVDARIVRDMRGSVVRADVIGLTWDGQDFLDAMRDDRVWSRAKKAIAESVGSTTFDVIKQVCVAVASKLAIAAIVV